MSKIIFIIIIIINNPFTFYFINEILYSSHAYTLHIVLKLASYYYYYYYYSYLLMLDK